MKFLLVALFVTYAAAALVSLEAPSGVHAGWYNTKTRPTPAALRQTRNLSFAIKQQNLDVLEKLFWQVTNPSDAMYGKYLSIAEITEIVAPKAESVEAVRAWLSSIGVTNAKLTPNRDWFTATMTLAEIEKAFGVVFTRYVNALDGRQSWSTMDAYLVPSELTAHLELVSGIVGLPNRKSVQTPSFKASSSSGTGDGPNDVITPPVVRAAYSVPATLVPTNANNSHAVAEFQAQYMKPADIVTFFGKYVTYSTADTVTHIVGKNGNSASLEGSLDIQYQMGIAPGIDTSFYSYESDNFYGDLNTWLTELASHEDLPWVFSVSYGSQGDYPTPAYRKRQDTEYQKLGMRGVSIIYASGDYGACGDGSCDKLLASYPAVSVYVTSVGATKFLSGNTGEEGAVVNFKSGGGFDDLMPLPSYQADVVEAYLKNAPNLPSPGAYNASNRATPDVAALGAEAFQVITNGHVTPVGGTSASAPSFAAIMVLLNDEQLNNNRPTLGFLNPWLYQAAGNSTTAFQDITVGNNIGCSEVSVDFEKGEGNCGFECTPGWDPVTGLGTPNYATLLTLLPASN